MEMINGYPRNFEVQTKDIHEGVATLPWAEKTDRCRAGWAIPGGGRIYDRAEAIRYAVRMSNYMIEVQYESV